jgi:hypothetical protein
MKANGARGPDTSRLALGKRIVAPSYPQRLADVNDSLRRIVVVTAWNARERCGSELRMSADLLN